MYWQNVKNELIAKVKQLGPFHLFFTFSCAENRWFDVMISALQKHFGNDIKIEFENHDDWNGSEDEIFVIHDNNKKRTKLWDYVESLQMSKHKLLKESMFLVTRHFNERVKSLIKNILKAKTKANDRMDVPIQYYTYRVEIQVCHFYH